MSESKAYDLVVIGSGTAAQVASFRVRAAGWSVAVIDHRPFGGTCALRGCDPKKMLISGAEAIGFSVEEPAVIPDSTITCPACCTAKTETMPTDACQYFYECTGCGELLRPEPGDCCVFCSYGSVPCPPIQAGETPTCNPI